MKLFTQTVEQIGNPDEYPVLFKLFKDIKLLESVKSQKKIFKYLDSVNKCSRTEIPSASPYVFKLVRQDFKERLEHICSLHGIPENIKSRANNYTNAKFHSSITSLEAFRVKNEEKTGYFGTI